MSVVSGVCCQVGLITRPEESHRVGVPECDREAAIMGRPWPTRGSRATVKKMVRASIHVAK